MTCGEFRQWFQDHESDEMTEAIQLHLASCEKCQRIVELDQELEARLHSSFEQLEVPERLQERLDQNLHGGTMWLSGSRMVRRVWAPALAMAAMLALFLLPFATGTTSFASMDELGQLAIIDHMSHDTRGCSSSALLDIGEWSEKEVGYRITSPVVAKGAKLLAAAKCRLGDCDTVHLMYSLGEERFSVFIFPKKEAAFDLALGRSYSLDFGKHQVKLWQTGTQIQAMVI